MIDELVKQQHAVLFSLQSQAPFFLTAQTLLRSPKPLDQRLLLSSVAQANSDHRESV
jgi:hypothetical protein